MASRDVWPEHRRAQGTVIWLIWKAGRLYWAHIVLYPISICKQVILVRYAPTHTWVETGTATQSTDSLCQPEKPAPAPRRCLGPPALQRIWRRICGFSGGLFQRILWRIFSVECAADYAANGMSTRRPARSPPGGPASGHLHLDCKPGTGLESGRPADTLAALAAMCVCVCTLVSVCVCVCV